MCYQPQHPFIVLHVCVFSDPTPTYSSKSLVSSPFLFLHNFGASLTACTTVNVTWVYAGPPLPLDLTATNVGVIAPSSQASQVNTFTDDQVLAVPSGASQPQPVRVSITQGIRPQASAVPWIVNVPSGWYQIFASLNSTFEDQTSPFFVQHGTDTSCLLGATPTSAVPISSSSSVSIPTSSGVTTTPGLTTRTNSSQVGVIIGVVAGTVVFLIIALIMYLWSRKRKNTPEKSVRGQPSGAKHGSGWGGLGSLNSAHFERRNRASCDLTSAASHEFANHGTARAGCAANDENRSDSSISCSPSSEKFAGSPVPYTNPFDDVEGGLVLATLPISSSKAPSQPLSSSADLHVLSQNNLIYHNEPHDTRERASFADVHLCSSYSSSPSADIKMARSYSTSSSTHSPSTDLNHQIYVNRQSTEFPSMTARRMPRKPVPVYDSSLSGPSNPNLTRDTSNPPVSYKPSSVSSHAPSPITPTTPRSSFSLSAYGHYSKKLQPSPDGNSLVHKSSFGPGGVEGKSVHYLIPDMPLPSKS